VKVAAILLAAGASSRMGQPKQLLPYGEETLVRWAARNALGSVCHPVFAVLGSASEMIRAELEHLPIQLLDNPEWMEGIGSSVRCGVRGALAAHSDLDAIVLLLADQPHVTSETINRLVETAEKVTKSIIASAYSDTVGVPALFTRVTFNELRNLRSDRGAKQFIASCNDHVVTMSAPEAERDIDTPENYRELNEVNYAAVRGLESDGLH
jgi:molybdenum cofactor cytidylyltransferase